MDEIEIKEDIKNEVSVSVRRLVEFVLRSGDIVAGGIGYKPDMQEGTRIHRKIQKAAGENYKAEVRLSYTREYESLKLTVQGIADGIIEEEIGVTIDEIKSTAVPLDQIETDFNKLHWAQALCYAFIYSKENSIKNINVRLTYYQIETQEIKYIINTYEYETLEKFFYDLTDSFFQWAEWEASHLKKRNDSIINLSFPFPSFRPGQREMAGNVYRVIKNKNILFAQASTGIGKTVSTLFPSLKAMGEGHGEKIFYLTAKTVAKAVAEASLLKMTKTGLETCSVTLTSKEKICEYSKKCHPDTCPFSKGHFDRVNQAIFDIINNEINITEDKILEYSKKHNVCPFEFSLDTAEWADVIICDYNYVLWSTEAEKCFQQSYTRKSFWNVQEA
ncbi:MAG: ATP-dependent helicase [Clostridia bacterium]|nr:ATP-dependent helicase [Clostridia bacterium]